MRIVAKCAYPPVSLPVFRTLSISVILSRYTRVVEISISVRRFRAEAKSPRRGLAENCESLALDRPLPSLLCLGMTTVETPMSEDSVDYETASESTDLHDLGESDSPSPSPPPSAAADVPPHRRNAERKHLPTPANNGPRQTERGTFQPRRRLSESELPKPNAMYLTVADQSSDTLSVPPLIVVLVFNTTLIQRRPGDGEERKDPLTRPYLSTFLSYLFHTEKDSSAQPLFCPRRPIQTVIYTGVRVYNILAVIQALQLAPPERKLGFRQPYSVDPERATSSAWSSAART